VDTEEKWNVPDKWYVSPYNYEKKVRSSYKNMPERITIRDVTLQEGQHQPGVQFTLEGMLKIARALYDGGVREFKQGGGDFQVLEFIRALKKELPDVKVSLITQVVEYDRYRNSFDLFKKQVDIAIQAGIDEAVFPGYFTWSCPKSIRDALPRDALRKRFTEAAKYVRSQGIGLEFGHVDLTRGSWEDLKEFHDIGLEAGMTRIGVYDSYGCITPDGMKYIVSKFKQEYKDIPILVHAHNDFGLAEANTVGGILGGATSCDLAVNGLGDRAGNASFEEVVLQLEALYAVKTGIKLENLVKLCRVVEEVIGIKPHPFKPIAGQNVFTHESEAHAKMVLEYGVDKKYVSWAEPYSPAAVGGNRTVRFGGTSLTGDMIRLRMNEIGLDFGEKEVQEVGRRIKDVFVTQKTDISLGEFDALAREVCKLKAQEGS
jgi:isopropylmalate/homocitrate/citramalate synthase